MKAALSCNGCSASFAHSSSLSYHRKTCKGLEALRIQELEAELAELRQHKPDPAPVPAPTPRRVNVNVNVNNSITHNGDVINNITVQHLNVTLAPNEFGRESMAHMWTLHFAELKKLLGLEANEETIANMVKNARANTRIPENHNVLLESPEAENGYVFKHQSWREQERDSMLNDCACDGATKLLDFEHIYAERMTTAAANALDDYRDHVEGLARSPVGGEGIRKPLYDAICRVLVEFTATQPALLMTAKANAAAAPKPNFTPSKAFVEWQPGGVRREAFLKKIAG